MITNVENSLVHSGETLKKIVGGIGNSAKIIHHLRTDLYQNPIKALVREILVNARDANREAGKSNVPLEVDLPSEFDPFFRVKDFGIGISPERMEQIYLQYGNSTKDSSNEETGGFGLGAKSPHAYTDNFTIITITDGIKRYWSIPRSELPTALLLAEEPTDEKFGTIVEVPMKSGDTKQFKEAYSFVVEFWKNKPCTKNLIIRNPKFLFSDEKEKFFIFDESIQTSNYNGENTIILIDELPYRITYSNLNKAKHWQYSGFPQKEEYLYLLNSNLLLPFANGELALTLSRDSIAFDEKTIEKIEDRLKFIYESIKSDFLSELEKKSTYFEAVRFRTGIMNKLHYSVSNSIFSSAKWKNISVTDRLQECNFGEHCKFFEFKQKSNKRKNVSEVCIRSDWNADLFGEKYIFSRSKNYTLDREKIEHFFPQGITVISIPSSIKSDKKDEIINCTYNEDFISIFSPIFLEDFELPQVQKDKKKFNRISSDKDHEFVIGHQFRTFGGIRYKAELIKNDCGAYIEASTSTDFVTQLYLHPKFRIIDQKICAFTPTRIKHLSKNWMKLEDAYQAKLKEIFSSAGEELCLIGGADLEFFHDDDLSSYDEKDLPKDLLNLKLKIEKYDSLKNNFLKNGFDSLYLEIDDIAFEVAKAKKALAFIDEYSAHLQKCKEKYSLFQFIGHSCPISEKIKYFNLIDKDAK